MRRITPSGEYTCTIGFGNIVLFSEKTDLGHETIEDEPHENANNPDGPLAVAVALSFISIMIVTLT